MGIVSTIARKIRSTKVIAGTMVLAVAASFSLSGVASATTGSGPYPSFFDVDKPTSQQICYKQFGVGWKEAGFRSWSHCLRYVSTPAPEDTEECRYGWWFVYGFNSFRQCADWVATHGGGYDGAMDEFDEEF